MVLFSRGSFMSDKSKPPIEEEARLTWPLSMGSEVEVATAFALTSIRGGHVLEIGRAILSGHAGRSTPEILEFLQEQTVNVLGRYFLPQGALLELKGLIEKRLETEAPTSPHEASPRSDCGEEGGKP
jgi:hypothetical protein